MKAKCKHKRWSTPGFYNFIEEDLYSRGLKQRQCPICKKWFFHGEFGKGWKQGIEYKENNAQ